MIQLAEIENQDASTLVCSHLICRKCGIVDRDYSRTRKGGKCSTCGKESEGGSLMFPTSTHILVDLVQQAFHSKSPVGPISGPQVPDIGTVLFYCTLREALLNALLLNHLRTRVVPEALVKKLLDDNKLASQKFGDLFTAVVGVKWFEAVAEASKFADVNFKPTSDLMRSAAALRNEFLHEGTGWQATHEFAAECLNSLPMLVELFVALHKLYVHPLYPRDI